MHGIFAASLNEQFLHVLVTAGALAMACAVLSVIVVLRRWAFIGEGISHSGFGGIGTAWLLSLLLPALGDEAGAYGVAVIFCLAVALGIAFFSRRQKLSSDVTIGVFLVASLAWGFLCLSIYRHIRPNMPPPDWERYLLGDLKWISTAAMASAVSLSLAVLLVIGFLEKEILAYAFEPMLAEVSGVRSGFIHYLLIVLLSLLIVLGMRLVGNLLIPALLVLPGAGALLVSHRLRTVLGIAMGMSLLAAVGGCVVNEVFPYLMPGPGIVLILFVEFLVAAGWAKMRGA